ncbi:conserved Plasmodium protein, unknown function [Plasmodium ovale wallikeri]|uniref:Uncharacterized protein n=1 Tax=Plasmodium ovale wallikeri TaxID=864142 RepID=A0A1A8ZPG0_PLAOA|nr:conserved Plasmodium protein, unknown function [Plasmodium ovale wallikeri]SBT46560.1 conserved Plasmodium protein, unknown function [Plasmodium ovale wallikeri]
MNSNKLIFGGIRTLMFDENMNNSFFGKIKIFRKNKIKQNKAVHYEGQNDEEKILYHYNEISAANASLSKFYCKEKERLIGDVIHKKKLKGKKQKKCVHIAPCAEVVKCTQGSSNAKPRNNTEDNDIPITSSGGKGKKKKHELGNKVHVVGSSSDSSAPADKKRHTQGEFLPSAKQKGAHRQLKGNLLLKVGKKSLLKLRKHPSDGVRYNSLDTANKHEEENVDVLVHLKGTNKTSRAKGKEENKNNHMNFLVKNIFKKKTSREKTKCNFKGSMINKFSKKRPNNNSYCDYYRGEENEHEEAPFGGTAPDGGTTALIERMEKHFTSSDITEEKIKLDEEEKKKKQTCNLYSSATVKDTVLRELICSTHFLQKCKYVDIKMKNYINEQIKYFGNNLRKEHMEKIIFYIKKDMEKKSLNWTPKRYGNINLARQQEGMNKKMERTVDITVNERTLPYREKLEREKMNMSNDTFKKKNDTSTCLHLDATKRGSSFKSISKDNISFKRQQRERTIDKLVNELESMKDGEKKKNFYFCDVYKFLGSQKKILQKILDKEKKKNNEGYLKELHKIENKMVNFVNHFDLIMTKKEERKYIFKNSEYGKNTLSQINILLSTLEEVIRMIKKFLHNRQNVNSN